MIKTITALMVLTLIATVSAHNAYAIEGDGTSHVEVDEYPFNITVEEGGSITIHNNGENTINFVSYGWFEQQTIPVNDAIVLEFPVVNCGTTCFTEGMYYISDLNGGQQSTIEIVKPYVAPPPTYQTTKDGITKVDVFTIPFDVTITENGSVTVHNTDSVEHVVSHTGTTGTSKSGTFYKVIPAQQQATIEFPITGSTIYESGVYTFEDTVTGKSGSVTVTPWIGSQQMIQENTVTGVSQSTVEQVGIQEDIVVVLRQESTPELIVDEGIYNVPQSKTNMDLITLQTQLATVTAQFNDSITKLADQKVTIESYDNEVQSLTTQIGTLNGTATEISTLEQTVLSLQLEKDTLNAQIHTLGNTTAIQQTTITQLNAQVNNTSILDGKIANLESQIVSLTSERDQWKQLANNWYGVAMEQLSVMINVLGL
ncbi:ELKS/Rab6-interacting/CAST family protein [Nitrosopumilus sp.]|nr:ELKS/Rab6-interacting/CAST family protein [Nitrosopumilus sp.]